MIQAEKDGEEAGSWVAGFDAGAEDNESLGEFGTLC